MTPSCFRRHCFEHGDATCVGTSHYTLPQEMALGLNNTHSQGSTTSNCRLRHFVP